MSSSRKLKRGGRLPTPLFLTISILLSFIMMRAHRRKANMSLCFSNKLRHTLLYRLKVKNVLMLAILSSTVSVRHMSRKKNQWKQKKYIFYIWSQCHKSVLMIFPSAQSRHNSVYNPATIMKFTVEFLSTCSLRVGNASHEDAKEPL